MTYATKLTTSGNSVAVRLPKELLKLSGLTNFVELEVRKNEIIIRNTKNQRDGWEKQIKKTIREHGDPAKEFMDMDGAIGDGLEDIPWDGPTYEEWLQKNDKHRAIRHLLV